MRLCVGNNQSPKLISPSGKTLILECENFVPVLTSVATGDGPLSQDVSASPGQGDTLAKPKKSKQPKHKPIVAPVTPPLPEEHYLTHIPKESRCEFCIQAKAQRKQCRRIKKNTEEEQAMECPCHFGDIVTADHIIIGDDEQAGRQNERPLLPSLTVLPAGLALIPPPITTRPRQSRPCSISLAPIPSRSSTQMVLANLKKLQPNWLGHMIVAHPTDHKLMVWLKEMCVVSWKEPAPFCTPAGCL